VRVGGGSLAFITRAGCIVCSAVFVILTHWGERVGGIWASLVGGCGRVWLPCEGMPKGGVR
jgi:hypothetical protein